MAASDSRSRCSARGTLSAVCGCVLALLSSACSGRVDVAVRDAGGGHASGLDATDFVVTHSGTELAVTSVHEAGHGGPGASVEGMGSRYFLLLIDDLQLRGAECRRAADSVRAFVKRVLRAGDRVSLVSTGPASLALDFTTDSSSVLVAVESAMRTGGCIGEPPANLTRAGASAVTLDTLGALLGGLGSVEGARKAVLALTGESSDVEATPGEGQEGSQEWTTGVDAIACQANQAAIPLFVLEMASEGRHRSQVRAVAEATGGVADVAANQEVVFRRIDEATKLYYQIEYSYFMRRLRRAAVDVSLRPSARTNGITLRHRRCSVD